MKFRQTPATSDELVAGIEVGVQNGVSTLKWVYPFKCDVIYIFEIPIGSNPTKEDFEHDKYEAIKAAHPAASFTSKRSCDFAVFSADAEGEAIFCENYIWRCKLKAEYRFVIKKEKTSFFDIFQKKTPREEKYLEVTANADISGERINYKLRGASGKFCLPFDVKCGQVYSAAVSGDIELYSDDENLVLENRGTEECR